MGLNLVYMAPARAMRRFYAPPTRSHHMHKITPVSQVGSGEFLPLATILTNIFRFFFFDQIPLTSSPVSGTLNNHTVGKHF
jgi:hypothetical protein